MGKALVIKDVDFGTNKLTTVVLGDYVPCTGLSLSESSVSIANIGTTLTLVATKTPADTTDSVLWASSDNNVVSVAGGVLTVTGVGSATITATCGSQTAICSVTTTNQLEYSYTTNAYCSKGGTGNVKFASLGRSGGGSPEYAGGYGAEAIPNSKILVCTILSEDLYPIKLSSGTSKITFTVPNTCKATVFFTNTATSSSEYAERIGVVGGDASPYDSSVAKGVRTVNVPEGADSFTFSVNYNNGTVTDEIMGTVTVVES